MPEITTDQLRDFAERIKPLDEKLAALRGTEDNIKAKVQERIDNENKDSVKESMDRLTTALENVDPEVLHGMIPVLKSFISSELTDKVNKYISEEVARVKSETPAVNQEELDKLLENRKQLVTDFKALKRVLVSFGVLTNPDEFPDPRQIRIPSGKPRKARRKGREYDYFVDNQKRSDSQNNLSRVVFDFTKNLNPEKPDKAAGTKWFKQYAESQGVNLKADTWELTLPNNHKIRAVARVTEQPPDEGGESDTESTPEFAGV